MQIELFFESHDGHTRKIATALCSALKERGFVASPRDLSNDFPRNIDAKAPCILISAIRYGHHLPMARKLLEQIAPMTPEKPLFLFSVNLTARKEEKRSAQGNTYLRKWIKKTGAVPVLAEAIAGKLDYPRYKFFDRTMIRFIMKITGGPTDPQTVHDYTPWDYLPVLAQKIAQHAKQKD